MDKIFTSISKEKVSIFCQKESLFIGFLSSIYIEPVSGSISKVCFSKNKDGIFQEYHCQPYQLEYDGRRILVDIESHKSVMDSDRHRLIRIFPGVEIWRCDSVYLGRLKNIAINIESRLITGLELSNNEILDVSHLSLGRHLNRIVLDNVTKISNFQSNNHGFRVQAFLKKNLTIIPTQIYETSKFETFQIKHD